MNERNTVQKSLVLEAAMQLDHPTAEEIFAHITGEHPAVSKGTVYRNLKLLVEQQKLRRVEVPDAADHFDHTLSNHYHIRCKTCGRVSDAALPFQHDLILRIGNTQGYRIDEHDIVFKGVCPVCLGKDIEAIE